MNLIDRAAQAAMQHVNEYSGRAYAKAMTLKVREMYGLGPLRCCVCGSVELPGNTCLCPEVKP
jgi:hypothetical protein